MKIPALPNIEDFVLRPCEIGGQGCTLVFPKKSGIVWNHSNKIFRSSVWSESGELVSPSFRKFTNLGEQPEFEPLNTLTPLSYVHKVDGSALIISKFQGQLVVRTRGTVDATIMENGEEIPYLQAKYPDLFASPLLEENNTLICEWFSPRNVIIERESSAPDLWLTGGIRHDDYSYFAQDELDELASSYGVPRPKRYSYDNLEGMRAEVAGWSAGEGIVIYGNQGQILKKVKSLRYLRLHKLKSELSSESHLLEYYASLGMPDYQTFLQNIQLTFDFELALQLQGSISRVCDAGVQVRKILGHMEQFIRELQHCKTRKEQAQLISQSYGGEKNSRTGMAFKLLDNKEISTNDYLKLLSQVLKDH